MPFACIFHVKILYVADELTPVQIFFSARRCPSAVLATVLCPSVRPSVRHKLVLYRNCCTLIELGFDTRASFNLCYIAL